MNKIILFGAVVALFALGCKETTTESTTPEGEATQPATETATTPAVDVSGAVDVLEYFNNMREDYKAYSETQEGKTILVKGIVSNALVDGDNITIYLDPIGEGQKWDAATANFPAGTDISEVMKLSEDEEHSWKITAYIQGTFSGGSMVNTTGRSFSLEGSKLLKVEKAEWE